MLVRLTINTKALLLSAVMVSSTLIPLSQATAQLSFSTYSQPPASTTNATLQTNPLFGTQVATGPIDKGLTIEPLDIYLPGSITAAAIDARRQDVMQRYLLDPSLEHEDDPDFDPLEGWEESGQPIDLYVAMRLHNYIDVLCRGRAAYALAAYYVGEELATADGYIEWIASLDFSGDRLLGIDPRDRLPCYFGFSNIWRVYLDPVLRTRMSDSARAALYGLLSDYVYERSRFDTANDSVWHVHGSDNHDIIRKASAFLGVQALLFSGNHSADFTLADGHTLQQHYDAWNAFFKRYFRERARHGLIIEVSSTQYEKYIYPYYYNIRDFAHSQILRTIADRFMTLYWTDTALDFIQDTGVRGGSRVRIYKNGYLTEGVRDTKRALAYVHGWLPDYVKPADVIVGPIASSYRVPDIVNAIALGNKAPYAYVSNPPGLGYSDPKLDTHFVEYFGGSSWIRRYSWITPEYVMGAMTYQTALGYTLEVLQNRTADVMLASDINSRVVVFGKGDDDPAQYNVTTSMFGGSTTGYREINAAAARDAMVIVREQGAWASNGMLIYLSYAGDVWANSNIADSWKNLRMFSFDSWIFTRSGYAFIAIRIANGDFSVRHVENHGVVLELDDMFSPIVVQMGRAIDYSDFEAFKASVRENEFSYDGARFSYATEAGDALEIVGNQPMVNGSANLLPTKSYDSPYLTGWSGEDTVRLDAPGFPPLALDFDYTQY